MRAGGHTVHHGRQRRVGIPALGLPIALLLATPGNADDPGSAPPVARRVEILAHVDGIAAEDPAWSLLSSLRISRDHGLSYRHSFVLAGHPVQVRLRGPVQPRKSLGLGLQIRF